MVVSGGKQPSSKSKGTSFDAFSRVDELVSKPVLGSDGAASWQAFRKDNRANDRHRVSVAPKAPLKKQDKLGTGFSTWEEERAHEGKVREEAGHASANSGYTAFQKDKSSAGEAAIREKRRAQVEARIRPDDKEYLIPSDRFVGWKFDYVFTTKNGVTGYYWDGMDSVKVQRGESLPGETTKGASSSSSSSSSSAKRVDQSENPDKDKPKKKRKKKKGPVIVHDPNNPMEQMQAILERRNQKLMGITTADNDLPSGWESAKDPSTGKTYYFQRATGRRTWDKPKPPAESTNGNGNDHGGMGQSLPPGWKSAVDRASGKTYYHHTSGKTTWTKPE